MLNRLLGLSIAAKLVSKQSPIFSLSLIQKSAMTSASEAPKTWDSPNIAQEPCASPKQNLTADEETVQDKTASNDNPQPLSKRAQKRLARQKVIEEKKKKRKEKKKAEKETDGVTQEQLKETEYYFENGLRKVYPYHFCFHTFAKGRWVGQKLLDIFLKEFRNDSHDSYQKAFEDGLVSVNGNKIDKEYVVQESDYIENRVHRHEMSVTSEEIEILEDNEEVLVVNKPSSIPIHPCGRYRHNSLMYILAKEHGYFHLRTFYRIDRLTSGLMIFPKTEKKTAELVDAVVKRNVEKTYICKVEGKFPESTIVCEEPLGQLDFQMGLHRVDPKGKESKTTFDCLSYDSESDTSIVRCKPHTGRTHQIRVHLQWLGYPITNDPLYNSHIWGPNKGKSGDFGKPINQLVEELKAHHSIENLGVEIDGPKNQKDVESKSAIDSQSRDNPNTTGQETEGEPVTKKAKLDTDNSEDKRCEATEDKRPGFDPSKLIKDPNCSMCACNFPDPPPDKLVMYLHALAYKGADWEYSTPMPKWANT